MYCKPYNDNRVSTIDEKALLLLKSFRPKQKKRKESDFDKLFDAILDSKVMENQSIFSKRVSADKKAQQLLSIQSDRSRRADK